MHVFLPIEENFEVNIWPFIDSINHKNHLKFKELLFSRRWCGITDRQDTDYDVKELGWNYYMNEFSATIGLEQLKKLDRLNKIRKKTKINR